MELSIEQLDLIEKYCTTGLNNNEQATLEQIPDWQEAIRFYQDFGTSMQVHGNELVRAKLHSFEAAFQASQVKQQVVSTTPLLSRIKETINYTLDELAALFAPVPTYQASLGMVSRGTATDVISPSNGIDAADLEELIFKTVHLTQEPFELCIENNKQDVLVELEIPSNVQEFRVSLAALNATPGRYYWKLLSDEDMFIGYFFIRKDLME